MTTSTTEKGTTQAGAAGAPKPDRKPRVAKPARHVAPSGAKAGTKASPAKKTPKRPKSAKRAAGSRDGSKTAQILDLLKRPGGATSKDLMETTGWQPHSVRGFLSGTIGKKMGLTVVSTKGEDGDRTYSVKA